MNLGCSFFFGVRNFRPFTVMSRKLNVLPHFDYLVELYIYFILNVKTAVL